MIGTEKSSIKSYDLTTEVPSSWQIIGLSAPQSDGVNIYRLVQKTQSAVLFHSVQDQFVQLRFQLYSPTTTATGVVKFDGKKIGSAVFPRGKFAENYEAGGFVGRGDHTITIDYNCGNQNCRGLVSQYWTRVTFIHAKMPTRTASGLNAERWWLDAPGSLLSASAIAPPQFDGSNYFRKVQNPEFTLSWLVDTNPVNISFSLYAKEPFRVKTRVGGQTISDVRGDAAMGVTPTLSLVAFPHSKSVSISVECLKTGHGCAVLYFPSISVLKSPVGFSSAAWIVILPGVLLLLAGLFWLLGLAPRRVATAG